MSALFTHAMRYEWADRNPIRLARQSAKGERIPDALELVQIQLLLSKLVVRERSSRCSTPARGFASANSWPCGGGCGLRQPRKTHCLAHLKRRINTAAPMLIEGFLRVWPDNSLLHV